MEPSQADEFMQFLGDTANAVAAWTGIKAQFVEAGWDERHAELMVLEMMRNVVKTSG